MNDDNLKAVNFLQCKNVDAKPYICLHGEYLFDSDFMPGQWLKVEVYNEKIVITPVKKKY